MVVRQRKDEIGLPFYRRLLFAFEARRMQVGVSQEIISEAAGLADRAYCKTLWPDSKAGRMAKWSTLAAYAEQLWPGGYEIDIHPTDNALNGVEDMRKRLHVVRRKPLRPFSHKDLVAELRKRGFTVQAHREESWDKGVYIPAVSYGREMAAV